MPHVANQGKVDRVLREALAIFVEEIGREDTIALLELAAARLRNQIRNPETPATQKKPALLHQVRKRVSRIRLKR